MGKSTKKWNNICHDKVRCLSFLTASIIHYTLFSKHLLVSKTSWRRLEDVFSVTIFHLPRRFQDVCLEGVLEDEKLLWQDMPWEMFRRPTKCLLGRNIHLYLKNLNLYLINLYLANLSFSNKFRQIQDVLIRTQ